MKHVSKELSKHALHAIKSERRREAKCDRRSAQQSLKDLTRKFNNVTVVGRAKPATKWSPSKVDVVVYDIATSTGPQHMNLFPVDIEEHKTGDLGMLSHAEVEAGMNNSQERK